MNPYLTSALNMAKRPGAVGALGAGLGFAHGLLAPDVEYDENGRPRRKSRIGSALGQAAAGGLGGIALGAGIKKFVVPGVTAVTNATAATGTPPAGVSPQVSPQESPQTPAGTPAAQPDALSRAQAAAAVVKRMKQERTAPVPSLPMTSDGEYFMRKRAAPTDSERAFQYPRLKLAGLWGWLTGGTNAGQRAGAAAGLAASIPSLKPNAGKVVDFASRLNGRTMAGLGGAAGFASGMLNPGEDYDPETGTYRRRSRIGAALSRGTAGTLGGFALGHGLQRQVIRPGILALGKAAPAEPLRPAPASTTAPPQGPT